MATGDWGGDRTLGGGTQQAYSIKALKPVETFELRAWAAEVAHARSVPIGYTTTWKRKPTPMWVLPGPYMGSSSTRTLKAVKRSFWHRAPYQRTLRVQCNEHGPFEFATINPTSSMVTNTWHSSDVLDVLVCGKLVFLSLSGGWMRARTYLQCDMDSTAAAAAVVSEWGWEEEDGGVSDNPPVLTDNGEAFVFNH